MEQQKTGGTTEQKLEQGKDSSATGHHPRAEAIRPQVQQRRWSGARTTRGDGARVVQESCLEDLQQGRASKGGTPPLVFLFASCGAEYHVRSFPVHVVVSVRCPFFLSLSVILSVFALSSCVYRSLKRSRWLSVPHSTPLGITNQ